jgi:hypothetical protein
MGEKWNEFCTKIVARRLFSPFKRNSGDRIVACMVSGRRIYSFSY